MEWGVVELRTGQDKAEYTHGPDCYLAFLKLFILMYTLFWGFYFALLLFGCLKRRKAKHSNQLTPPTNSYWLVSFHKPWTSTALYSRQSGCWGIKTCQDPYTGDTVGLWNSAWFNPLNAELNPICHLLALLGAHYILHVTRVRVKQPDASVGLILFHCRDVTNQAEWLLRNNQQVHIQMCKFNIL